MPILWYKYNRKKKTNPLNKPAVPPDIRNAPDWCICWAVTASSVESTPGSVFEISHFWYQGFTGLYLTAVPPYFCRTPYCHTLSLFFTSKKWGVGERNEMFKINQQKADSNLKSIQKRRIAAKMKLKSSCTKPLSPPRESILLTG